MWVAAAAPGASRGALPTVLLLALFALPAAGRGLVAGLVVCYEPVAGLVAVLYVSVVQPFRLSWCIGHRFLDFLRSRREPNVINQSTLGFFWAWFAS